MCRVELFGGIDGLNLCIGFWDMGFQDTFRTKGLGVLKKGNLFVKMHIPLHVCVCVWVKNIQRAWPCFWWPNVYNIVLASSVAVAGVAF